MMKRIKKIDEIKPDRFYHAVVFTQFGVLTSAVLAGFDMKERMKKAKYEKEYDLFFFPGDASGYDIFEQEDY